MSKQKNEVFSPIVHSRSAFTLVELLVVIAIIGVLIALLLPAVQAAREAARRAQCTNKLKQLGLAVHNYHGNYSALPAGQCGNYGPTTPETSSYRWGIFVAILPYVEQVMLYDKFLSTNMSDCKTGTGDWFGTSQTFSAGSATLAPVPFLHCPSDAGAGTQASNRAAGTNYRYNFGDNASAGVTNVPTSSVATRLSRGQRGPFGYYSFHNFAAIADGTSNTLMFSERCLVPGGSAGTSLKVKDAVARSTTEGDIGLTPRAGLDPTYLSKRSDCRKHGIGGEISISSSISANATCGVTWYQGVASQSTFVTVLSPNSVSCVLAAAEYNSLVTPTSYHTGGVNCTLMDGSVRFISEAIDEGDFANEAFDGVGDAPIGEVSGPSPFGVWGAYGSRDGGESTSL